MTEQPDEFDAFDAAIKLYYEALDDVTRVIYRGRYGESTLDQLNEAKKRVEAARTHFDTVVRDRFIQPLYVRSP